MRGYFRGYFAVSTPGFSVLMSARNAGQGYKWKH